GVAAALPLQADAAWLAVGWAAQGLALWWAGLRLRSEALRGLGVVLLALAAIRLVFVDTAGPAHDAPFVPLFNRYGLPGLFVAGALIAAAALAFRERPAFGSPQFVAMRVIGIAGCVLLWLVLSVEGSDYFMGR